MKKLTLIFLGALALRLLFVLVWHEAGRGDKLSSDSTHYYLAGKNLVEGKGFYAADEHPARRPPLYSLLVGVVSKVAPFPIGVQLAQAVMGALGCVVLFALANEIFGHRIGLLASLLMAIDYASIRFTVEVMAENLFIFLILLSLYFLYRYHRSMHGRFLVLAGFFSALATLTRESLLYYFLFAGLCFLLSARPWQKKIRETCSFVTVFLLVLSPWILRNSLVNKQFTLISTSSGHYLYLGNNEAIRPNWSGGEWDFDHHSYFPQNDPNLDVTTMYTPEADRYLFKKAVEFITTHPKRFLELMAAKFVGTWRPYHAEAPPVAKWASAITYLPVVLLGLFGMITSVWRWRALAPLYGLIGYVFLLHLILQGVIRYRSPAMPFIMLFAAAGSWRIVTRWKLRGLPNLTVKNEASHTRAEEKELLV